MNKHEKVDEAAADEQEKVDVRAPRNAETLGFPDKKSNGKPEKSFANAMHALQRLDIECRHDIWSNRYLVNGHVIEEHAGEISDDAILALRDLIQLRFKFDPGRENTWDAVKRLCGLHRFDPVLDYFASLPKWDGQRRIDRLFIDYLGAADNELNRAFGRKTLAAIVRRARNPGIKFDHIPTMIGAEGVGKSMFLNDLAISDDWFTDAVTFKMEDRKLQEALQGRLIVEISELAGLRKASDEAVKRLTTMRADRGRRAYGRAVVDQQRRNILCGTTNAPNFLQSVTGNRRFWCVEVEFYNREAFLRDRDQIFAEAVLAEEGGETLYLSDELKRAAHARTELHMVESGIKEAIEAISVVAYKENPDKEFGGITDFGAVGDDLEMWVKFIKEFGLGGHEFELRIPTRKLLDIYLNLPKQQQTDEVLKRVAHEMRRCGWEGPTRLRFGSGNSQKGYRSPVFRKARPGKEGQQDAPM